MTSYPHAPDMDVVREAFIHNQSLFVPAADCTAALLATRNERFLARNAGIAVDCARAAYALGEPPERVLGFLTEASDCVMQVLKAGAPIGMPQLSEQLSIAIILERTELVRTLAALPPERYAVEGLIVPAPVQAVFRIYGLLACGDGVQARQGLAELDASPALAKLPRAFRKSIDPIRMLENAIAEHDDAAFAEALDARLAQYAKQYSAPDLQNYPDGLIDLQALGLLRLARKAGMQAASDAVYCPRFLQE